MLGRRVPRFESSIDCRTSAEGRSGEAPCDGRGDETWCAFAVERWSGREGCRRGPEEWVRCILRPEWGSGNGRDKSYELG